jgi:crooked neck
MVFADDEREANPTSFKFLSMAHAWKQKLAAGSAGAGAPGPLSGFATASAVAAPAREEQTEEAEMAPREDDEASSAASSNED